MKTTLAILCALAFAGAVRADPFGTGYLSVTVQENHIDPYSDFSLFLLKDSRWEIGNCVRLFNRNQSEDQQAGAFADTSVPLSWLDYGFGLEWAARNRDDIITLSNQTGWSVGPVDGHGAFLLSCSDARFGSVVFSVSSVSNAVPDHGAPNIFLVAIGLLIGAASSFKFRT